MLYIVETNLADRSLLEDWNRWYTEHLQVLLAVPGFLTAQRFETTTPVSSPFVTIYTLANADVMTSDAYRAKAGPTAPGRWVPLMTNWKRNLLEGLDRAPEVPMAGWLAVMDRHSASAEPLPKGFIALRPIGLDCSIVERGLLFGIDARAAPEPREEKDWHLRICTPLTPLLVADAARRGER